MFFLHQGIKSEHVLVGYKPYSNEEFLLCTTDKSKQYIEEKEIQSVRELKEKVELSLCRVPGHWNSRNSERDIEEIKSVQTREKVKYYIFDCFNKFNYNKTYYLI